LPCVNEINVTIKLKMKEFFIGKLLVIYKVGTNDKITTAVININDIIIINQYITFNMLGFVDLNPADLIL